ncbi:hypothetical protein ACMU_04585 [Actibacterium mucosum KCTC 23349]|uniref:SGNH domain-containing protein n=1 Tax=Actibacterium mucosum KCTC 23349 TaxID=1454373 RepID=A0A037ZEP2_9RHOB|nr:hypothetical protein [Actibacterium mucosum]KAJ53986.1 hypothetical protein ACMU_04585 [Actibacterium mucosum KCTC 23349]
MLSPNKTLCIYGDSHLASLKHALDAGVDGAGSYTIEFYGAPGPEFRGLRLTDDGAVVPDDEALTALEMVNGTGRTRLEGSDFDAFLFHGARMRSTAFIAEFLHRARDADGFVSAAVRRAALERWLSSIRSVRVARAFAAAGARVFFSPAPFEVPGAGGQKYLETFPEAAKAEAKDRTALNDEIADVLAKDGITFVAQPDETVQGGCLTDAAYQVENAAESGDFRHMNGEYGAKVLRAVLAQL